MRFLLFFPPWGETRCRDLASPCTVSVFFLLAGEAPGLIVEEVDDDGTLKLAAQRQVWPSIACLFALHPLVRGNVRWRCTTGVSIEMMYLSANLGALRAVH